VRRIDPIPNRHQAMSARRLPLPLLSAWVVAAASAAPTSYASSSLITVPSPGRGVAAFAPLPATHRRLAWHDRTAGAGRDNKAVVGPGRGGVPSLATSSPGGGGSDDPAAELRKKAERLRAEVEALEEGIRSKRAASPSSVADPAASSVKRREAQYQNLSDSAWTVSYRFASDPPPKDGEKVDEDDAGRMAPVYSGKVDVLFRPDGYTDILSGDNAGAKAGIQYTKFWGWDEEFSNLDNQRYLLFSADVMLPDSDPITAKMSQNKERFYFNARVDVNYRTGFLSLSDGTVTVKRDVEAPGGFWGVFSGQGILAEFRKVGEFVCRPIKISEQE